MSATEKHCKRDKEVTYDFNNLSFWNQISDTFRASITPTDTTDGITLWLESKNTKNQWQSNFDSIIKCGPAGVPEDVVVSLLKKALISHQTENANLKMGDDDPKLNLEIIENVAVLTLTMSMGGIWKPKFEFSLLPVNLDKLDVLEAKLRDAQDEIQELKKGLKVIFFSVCSAVACKPDQPVVWNRADSYDNCTTHFLLSEDKKIVYILKRGIYQLNVSLSGSSFSILRNAGVIAGCTNAGSYYSLTKVLRLEKNDALKVLCTSRFASDISVLTNNFSLVFLGY